MKEFMKKSIKLTIVFQALRFDRKQTEKMSVIVFIHEDFVNDKYDTHNETKHNGDATS